MIFPSNSSAKVVMYDISNLHMLMWDTSMSRPSTFMKRSQELVSQTTKTSLAKWFQGQQKRQYMKTCRNCCIISKFMSRCVLHVWPCFVKEANIRRIEIKYGICSMLSSFTTYYYTTCLH